MCGRFVGAFSTTDLVEELSLAVSKTEFVLDVSGHDTLFAPNYNTAPTHSVPILRMEEQKIVVDAMQWGLVPTWSKDPNVGSKMINARSETITEKPSFRNQVPRHRCIIPINGFYEWDRSDPKRKVPYYVTREDGHLMLVAGIWASSPALEGRHTFSLITRESVDDLLYIHNRSPVELTSYDALEWMSSAVAPLELFSPAHQPRFATLRVSTRVNSVRNNDASLILPDEEPLESGNLTLF
ncbi:MAG: SOS response-associated peptidase [Actinobacteria bacterium]|nr:SOS response-associated peptidase [Actinomycetota bacterium]